MIAKITRTSGRRPPDGPPTQGPAVSAPIAGGFFVPRQPDRRRNNKWPIIERPTGRIIGHASTRTAARKFAAALTLVSKQCNELVTKGHQP